jgi:hypothetical protein
MYLVVGWSRASDGRLRFAFHTPASSTPGNEVEKALDSKCVSIHVVMLDPNKDFMEQGETYVEAHSRLLERAGSIWPSVEGGATVCDIEGEVLRTKEPSAKYQGTLYTANFEKKGSTTPREDVERALGAGSIWVLVSKRLVTTSPESL